MKFPEHSRWAGMEAFFHAGRKVVVEREGEFIHATIKQPLSATDLLVETPDSNDGVPFQVNIEEVCHFQA